jgi:hypothetical protein
MALAVLLGLHFPKDTGRRQLAADGIISESVAKLSTGKYDDGVLEHDPCEDGMIPDRFRTHRQRGSEEIAIHFSSTEKTQLEANPSLLRLTQFAKVC